MFAREMSKILCVPVYIHIYLKVTVFAHKNADFVHLNIHEKFKYIKYEFPVSTYVLFNK